MSVIRVPTTEGGADSPAFFHEYIDWITLLCVDHTGSADPVEGLNYACIYSK